MGGSIGEFISDKTLRKKRFIVVYNAKDEETKNFDFVLSFSGKTIEKKFYYTPCLKHFECSELRLSKLILSLGENDFPLNYCVYAVSKINNRKVYKSEDKRMFYLDNFVIILDFVKNLKFPTEKILIPITEPQFILNSMVQMICKKYLSLSLIIHFFGVFNQAFPQEIEYNNQSKEAFNCIISFNNKNREVFWSGYYLLILFADKHEDSFFFSIGKLEKPMSFFQYALENLKYINQFLPLREKRYEFLTAYLVYFCLETTNLDSQIDFLLSIPNEKKKENGLASFINIYARYNKLVPCSLIKKVLPLALNYSGSTLFTELIKNVQKEHLLSFLQSCDEILPLEDIPYLENILRNLINPIVILEDIKNCSDKIINIFTTAFYLEKFTSYLCNLKNSNLYIPSFIFLSK